MTLTLTCVIFDTRYFLIGIAFATFIHVVIKLMAVFFQCTFAGLTNCFRARLKNSCEKVSLKNWLKLTFKVGVQFKPIWTIDYFKIVKIFRGYYWKCITRLQDKLILTNGKYWSRLYWCSNDYLRNDHGGKFC